MCRNLLCSAITASIPVRRLFSMDGRPPNQGSGYLVSQDVVTMVITEWQGAYTRWLQSRVINCHFVLLFKYNSVYSWKQHVVNVIHVTSQSLCRISWCLLLCIWTLVSVVTILQAQFSRCNYHAPFAGTTMLVKIISWSIICTWIHRNKTSKG